ncbi:MAG: hypothetical protein ACLR4Z_18955 [Butyricicoccaceae bacterium]
MSSARPVLTRIAACSAASSRDTGADFVIVHQRRERRRQRRAPAAGGWFTTFAAGADGGVTLGNHAFGKRQIVPVSRRAQFGRPPSGQPRAAEPGGRAGAF